MTQKLNGATVDVQKTGTLLLKSRFVGPKKPRFVSLFGVKLHIHEHEGDHPIRTYEIRGAKLTTNKTSLRIAIHISSKEKVTFYALSEFDFNNWLSSLTDSTQWNVHRFYDFGEELGHGAFSTVKLGIHKVTGDKVAIKVIKKGSCSEEDIKYLQREIDIARSISHPHVAKTFECYESDTHLYIVVEYMAGGTLEDALRRAGPCIPEAHVRSIMRDIFHGLAHLHAKGIVHRDIKPDNLLSSGKELPCEIKFTDFGLARKIENSSDSAEIEDYALGPEGLMTTPVGTPNFVAPEVLHGLPYGKEVDLFSCGVVMYYLLCGKHPFGSDDPARLVEQIKRTEYSFPPEQWSNISNEAKTLIESLLDKSPFTRITAEDALNHRWTSGQTRMASEEPTMLQGGAKGDVADDPRGARWNERMHSAQRRAKRRGRNSALVRRVESLDSETSKKGASADQARVRASLKATRSEDRATGGSRLIEEDLGSPVTPAAND